MFGFMIRMLVCLRYVRGVCKQSVHSVMACIYVIHLILRASILQLRVCVCFSCILAILTLHACGARVNSIFTIKIKYENCIKYPNKIACACINIKLSRVVNEFYFS